MNEKEVAELRRRFKADRSAITHVRGCYVNVNREIVAQFDQPMSQLTQDETEHLLGLLRKTLSGGIGKNLTDITFATRQVVEGEEHKRLMALRDSKLQDEEAVQSLFRQIIQTLDLDGENYLILLAHDAYDVPYKAKDGAQMEDSSEEVFSYILCSICPVKQTKPALSFYVQESAFHSLSLDWVVSPPELGFLFPAFDERSTNLYNALYYCRNTEENHQAFVDGIFRAQVPMAPAAQKETFTSVLGDTLEEECCLEVVQAVQDKFGLLAEEHKENHVAQPLTISKNTVKEVLSTCGVPSERVVAFGEEFDRQFGDDAVVSPRNLMDHKQLELRTPDVTIKVSADRGDLVETRMINGVKYILVRADEGVEVNGVPIHIS